MVDTPPALPPMTRRERLRAAVERRPVDRMPYAAWRPFPAVDRSPAGLAQATLRFHERYGSDFLVLLPSEGYAVEAWGCVEDETPDAEGRRACARCAVVTAADWRGIGTLDPAGAPGYATHLETIVRLGFDRRLGDAPVLLSLLSPLAIADRLSGGRLVEDLRAHPALVLSALEAIAETTLRFAETALGEGLGGVFYAARTPRLRIDDGLYARFGEPYDRRLLQAIRGAGRLTLVHAAGDDAPLDRLATLPADAWSWDAGATGPSLPEGHARLPGAVVGGLDARRTLRDGTPEAAVREAEAAIRETGGLGLVVAPGRALLPSTPDAPLAAVVRMLGGALRPLPGLVA